MSNRFNSTEIDKSSADVAAEGAILNEMLEIVKKRAALRPSDTMVGSDGGGGYDVSDGASPSTSTTSPLHDPSCCSSLTENNCTLHTLNRMWRLPERSAACRSGAILGAVFAIIVLIVAFVYPELVVYCSER